MQLEKKVSFVNLDPVSKGICNEILFVLTFLKNYNTLLREIRRKRREKNVESSPKGCCGWLRICSFKLNDYFQTPKLQVV